MKQTRTLGSDFTLGGEQAEADPLLRDAFYASGHYSAVVSREDPRCFVIGRTGSGKSAILQQLELEHPSHVIRITPEDLALPYVSDLGIINLLTGQGVHMDSLFIALWKHVLLVEIIKHRYKVNTVAAKQNFLQLLREKIKSDKSKTAALEYLDEFEGKFWCETDERVKDITRRFEEQITAEAGVSLEALGLGPGLSLGGAQVQEVEVSVQQKDKFQRIVNETQLPRLNKMISVLDEDILDGPQHFTYVVIDDLDKDWADEKVANDLIRCLFRAVVDLKKVQNLKVLVALRTNIFESLDFGRKTGGQEEKFRALSLHIRWSQSDLEGLVSERAQVAATRQGYSQVSSIRDLLPPSNSTRGNALSYIFERTLMRPRDIITYFNHCFALASGKTRLTWDHVHAAERGYSTNRLLALRDEWKPTYPGIEDVLRTFDGLGVVIPPEKMMHILDDVVLLVSESDFEGTVWLETLSKEIWSSKSVSDKIVSYQGIISLLYRIGFIGLQTASPGRALGRTVYAQEDLEYADRASNLRKTTGFCIHPAFREALDIH
jgi:hypothetical protein